jgi:hypothetical protein
MGLGYSETETIEETMSPHILARSHQECRIESVNRVAAESSKAG